MKSTFLIVLLFASLTLSRSQDIGTKYSGRADVPGLGTVEFPAGEWFLEFRRPPPTPNPAHRPDYFGFRKVADTPERLGFRRYEPTTAPDQLVRCLDGIAEDLGEGAPKEELGIPAAEGTSYPMRSEPPLSYIKLTTGDIAYSFINIRPNRPLNWLCHVHLFTRDGWAFVVFHASPSVTNPDTVRDITWISRPPTPTADEPKELTEARNQYLQTLMRMKDEFTRSGKGEDALAVQKEIDAVSPQSRLLKRLANTTWAYSFKPNDPQPTLTVTIHDDQTVSWSDRPSLRVAFQALDGRSLQVRDRYWKFSTDLQSFTIHPDKNEPAHRWGTRIETPK